MSFFRGFRYAFRGFIHCIKNERNMRFHTVAALYVLIFARFFDFTAAEYALLLAVIGGVMALEAVNTAVEELCDKVCTEHDPQIGLAKDAAAGAVLIMAAFAAAVGVLLFRRAEGWLRAWEFYTSHPLNAGVLILSLPVLFCYVFVWGRAAKRNSQGRANGKEEEK